MRQLTTKKKAAIGVVFLLFFQGINGILLHLDTDYKLAWYFGGNVIFLGVLIIAYRSWFASILQRFAQVRQQIGSDAVTDQTDELDQAINIIQRLIQDKEKAVSFVTAIGQGDFEIDVEENVSDEEVLKEEKDDMLLKALLDMRNQLKNIAENEQERNWVAEKLGLFSEIFRSNTSTLSELCNMILSRLVTYIGANQAAIFIVSQDEEQESYLEMTACYAYEKRKYLEKKVKVGEGLLGQTFLERKALYMTNLPERYTNITSGLGGGTPRCLLIVPMMQNEDTLGVLEIASFQKLEAYKVEFVEKLSESIASAIATVRSSEHTAMLLEESQRQMKEVREKEEQMRQNMEELQLTQEKSRRAQQELVTIEQNQRQRIRELNEARVTMQEQEEALKASHAKTQKRSMRFKEKMEQLDMEIESKNAKIKTLIKRLEDLQEKHQLSDKEVGITK